MTDPLTEAQENVAAARREATRQEKRDEPKETSKKSYHTILEQQVSEAEEELHRPATALLLSGLTAGLDLGFGPFAMAVLYTLTAPVFSRPVQDLLAANLYAAGFVFVVLGHSALFTEHTTSAVQPVLAGRSSVRQLLRLWGLVLVANLAGAAAFAWYATYLGEALGIVDRAVFGDIAGKMVRQPAVPMIASAIAAGWLMGLLSWLSVAARESMSQMVAVWLTTGIIGLAGLHHSIAGTAEVLMGVFSHTGAGWGDFGRFIACAVLGNAIGGSVFVAVLKSSHVRRSRA